MKSFEIEKNFDHATCVIDLYTRSYEQFKSRSLTKFSLYIAVEIAKIYQEAGKFEMALRFYNRIAKTYRKDKWDVILSSLLKSSVECAISLGLMDVVVEGLVELIALSPNYLVRVGYYTRLMDIIGGKIETVNGSWTKKVHRQRSIVDSIGIMTPMDESATGSPSVGSVGPVNVNVNMDGIFSFITCTVQFQQVECLVDSSVYFQVTLSSSDQTPPSTLRISKLLISFSDPEFDYCINTSQGTNHYNDLQDNIMIGENGYLQLVNIRDSKKDLVGVNNLDGFEFGIKKYWTKYVDLDFKGGSTNVFEGIIHPIDPISLKITCVSVIVEGVAGSLIMNYRISDRTESILKRQWIVNQQGTLKRTILDGVGECNVLNVLQRQPNVTLNIQHSAPAYYHEIHTLVVVVFNHEKEPVLGFLSVEYLGTNVDDGI